MQLFPVIEEKKVSSLLPTPVAPLVDFRSKEVNKDRSKTVLTDMTGRPDAEVAAAVDSGNTYFLEQEAKGVAETGKQNAAISMVQDMHQSEVSPEQAAVQLAEAFASTPIFSGIVDPAVVSFAMQSDNPTAKRAVLNKLVKSEIAYQIAMRKIDEFKGGSLGGVADWTASFVSSVVPVYSLTSGMSRAELSNKFVALFEANLTEEEFAEEVTKLYDEAGDIYDLFGGSNRVNLEAFLATASDGGYGTSNKIDIAAGFVDLALINPVKALKATTAVGKGLYTGTASATVDIARLAGIVKRDPALVGKILSEASIKDDPVRSAAILANHTNPSIASPNATRPRYTLPAANTAVKDWEDSSRLWDMIKYTKGVEMVDEAAFQSFKADYIASKKANGSRQVIDYDMNLEEGLENIVYTEVHGTPSGLEFKSAVSAQRHADVIGNAQVVPGQQGGWIVVKEENIPLVFDEGNTIEGLHLFQKAKIDELGYGSVFAKYGSPLAQTTDLHQALLIQREGQTARLTQEISGELGKLIYTMKPSEIAEVSNMMDELRDSASIVMDRNWTTQEFKDTFLQKYGRQPLDEQTAYYLRTTEINDIDWRLQADLRFKDEVQKGTTVLTNLPEEKTVRPVTMNDIPSTDLVWDADKSKVVPKSTIPVTKIVYSIVNEDLIQTPQGYIQYIVTSRPKTRRLVATDVMPYRPGGRRLKRPNSENFFLKQDNELSVAGGRKVAGTPKTFMSVKLETEATTAKRQINAIVDSINANLPVPKGSSWDQVVTILRNNANDAKVNSAIRGNNSWHLGINSIDELVDFAEANRINFSEYVDFASDGTRLMDTRNDFVPGINRMQTFGESFRMQGIRKGGRKDTPLIGFGGGTNIPLPYSEATHRVGLSAVATRTESAYAAATINAILKTAIEEKVLTKPAQQELAGLTMRGKLSRMKELVDTKTVAGKKIKLEMDKIEYRLNKRTTLDRAWDNFRFAAADMLYGKGWRKTAQKFDMWSTSPATAIRGWLFDAYLGLGAWDQIYVQGSQLVNIASIAEPSAAVKGTAMYGVNRFVLMNGKPQVLDFVADRVAPIYGITKDQYKEMMGMLKESGRTILDLSIAELGDTGMKKGLVSTVRDKSRVFFKEGELIGAINAHVVSYLEYLQKFPGVAVNTQAGRRWVARRQNVLRQAMTFANRSPGQTLPMVQFMTYSWRVAEALFAGSFGGTARKVLTAQEKAKFLSVTSALYGLAAVPFAGYVGDRIYQQYGTEVNPELYTAMRFGMLDFLLSTATGADTALSTRIGWGEGVAQSWFNALDKNIMEALAGPSGQFTGDVLGDLKNFLSSLRYGWTAKDYTLAGQDFTNLARNVKSFNLAYQTYIAVLTEEHYTRKGTAHLGGVDPGETVALAFGIPLQKMVENQTLKNTMFKNAEYEKTVADRIEQMIVLSEKLVKEGDNEGARSMRKAVSHLLDIHDPAQRERIWEKVSKTIFNQLDSTISFAQQQDLNTYKLGKE